MLIPVTSFFDYETGVLPKTQTNELLNNINIMFKTSPWFKEIYFDVVPNRQNIIVIKCKWEVDVDELPSRYDAHQIKYIWDGKKDLTIEEARDKFLERYGNESWFHSIEINEDGKSFEITTNGMKHKKFDFYENFPVGYGIKKKD